MSDKPLKTLILYATKYGAAGEIARRIAEKTDGAALHDLKKDDVPNLAEYDCVIVGSSVYAGRIRKEAKVFLSHNSEALRSKRFGLFISGMDTDNEKDVLAAAYSKELVQSAKTASLLGGIFDPDKAGFFERLIMRIVTKKSEYINTIDDEKIAEFVKALTEDAV
jgi:menaquinone-dependent protoporphyrinogen oxidase